MNIQYVNAYRGVNNSVRALTISFLDQQHVCRYSANTMVNHCGRTT